MYPQFKVIQFLSNSLRNGHLSSLVFGQGMMMKATFTVQWLSTSSELLTVHNLIRIQIKSSITTAVSVQQHSIWLLNATKTIKTKSTKKFLPRNPENGRKCIHSQSHTSRSYHQAPVLLPLVSEALLLIICY